MEKLGTEVLKNCRNQWYCHFPFLDGAFAGVEYQASPVTKEIATDGNTFFFSPEFLVKAYGRCPAAVRRGYLHMLLHCLYLHVIPEPGSRTELWDLACDLAVEAVIEREARDYCAGAGAPGECFTWMGGSLLSAQQIYRRLEQKEIPISSEELRRQVHFDDHVLWRTNQNPSKREALERKWELLRRLSGREGTGLLLGSGGMGRGEGTGEDAPGRIEKSRYNYRSFLKRFALPREEMELDAESFDYIYYSYGMERYGNMPLIEPLEYKEGHKLEELVIAIDTSGSCSTELVRRFLSETYGILGEKENFFRRMKVYFIQCDCVIQDAALIRSKEEWEAYCRNLKIQGRAGTDFRPVFRYIQELQKKKELKDPKALIYFTDGDGIYPGEAPEYETAFVFVKKTDSMGRVPAWALRLVTGEKGL